MSAKGTHKPVLIVGATGALMEAVSRERNLLAKGIHSSNSGAEALLMIMMEDFSVILLNIAAQTDAHGLASGGNSQSAPEIVELFSCLKALRPALLPRVILLAEGPKDEYIHSLAGHGNCRIVDTRQPLSELMEIIITTSSVQ